MQPELALAEFGFSELESRLYCELLRVAPATGYRLAQLIGKAPANVYQALAAMTRKGIVFVDEGDTKTYRASPPSELMRELQEDFDGRRSLAERALESVHAPPDRDRIYQIRTARQVLERAQSMIEDAREIVLFDLFPEPLAVLAPALEAAAASGIVVVGRTYGDATALNLPRVTTPLDAVHPWPGQQISIIVDAEQYLQALLSADGGEVLHGLWSESRYLACLQHSGLASEIRLATLDWRDDRYAHIGLLRAMPVGLRELMRESDAEAGGENGTKGDDRPATR